MKKKTRFLGFTPIKIGEVKLTETEQAILNEAVIRHQNNLSYDETVFNHTLREIKEFLATNDIKSYKDNLLQIAFHKNVEYANWLLTTLGCELDKSYTIEELKEMSKMTWDEFNSKVNKMEKWDVNSKIPNPRKH